MNKFGLVSAYTQKKHKKTEKKVNESPISNLLDREFDNQTELAVVVSDSTYVRVREKWHYICILLDLYNREIIINCCQSKVRSSKINSVTDYKGE